MYLYLVQHAEAKSKEEDPSRSLTEKGTGDIRKVAEYVRDMNIKVHHLLQSGKKRANQTAQILEENFTTETGVAESDGLAPMDEPKILFDRLSAMDEDTMLVGHLPHLAKLASMLICGSTDKNVVGFEMGCIVCLKRPDDGIWTIDWIIKPGMIT